MNFHEPSEPIAVLRIPRAGNDRCTLNQRVHWSVRNRTNRAWRDMTLIQCRIQKFPKNLPASIVEPTFVFTTNHHRDPGNFVATTKVIIDALKAGTKKNPGWGAWPDDDPRYLTELMPRLVVHRAGVPGVIVRIYPRPEDSRYAHHPIPGP